jgi:NAD(P)-dependent dehydrogenase (short-subunit alcohol dehydrogenase family)/acyl carrier protein
VFSDTINPKDTQAFRRLFAENPGNFRGVVHLAAIEDIQSATENSQSSVVDLQSSLHLLQSMIAAGWTEAPRLWFVTRGAVAKTEFLYSGGENAKKEFLHSGSVRQTPLWGLGKVFSLEHPEFQCVCTDLDPSESPEQNARALFEELQISDSENQVMRRQGARYVARLAKALLQETNDNLRFDENAGYLITGGLGGLGLRIAQWMAENGARHIVLAGRSGASKPEAQEAVKRLETSGIQVLVVKADVSLREDVAGILDEIKAAMPPLKGIIHAAGVLDDGMLRQQTYERFQGVIAPKADGAWHLHTLTLDMPLDFFVCFSSMTSLFGATAQGNYAAANAFMDGLAHYRRAMGLPGLSINWGPWAEAGMVATLTKRDQQRIAEQGLSSIVPEQGLQILGELLQKRNFCTPPGQEIVQIGVISVNWPKFIKHFFKGIKPPFFEAFIPPETQEAAQKAQLLRQLEAAEMRERRDLLIAHIRSLAAKVLDLNDPERIGLRQRLFDLGIDSLMAVDLKNRLESDLGHTLRSTLVFDYPMVEAIADHLIEDVLSALFSDSPETSEKTEADTLESELEDISEAEAEAMLLRKIEKMETV